MTMEKSPKSNNEQKGIKKAGMLKTLALLTGLGLTGKADAQNSIGMLQHDGNGGGYNMHDEHYRPAPVFHEENRIREYQEGAREYQGNEGDAFHAEQTASYLSEQQIHDAVRLEIEGAERSGKLSKEIVNAFPFHGGYFRVHWDRSHLIWVTEVINEELPANSGYHLFDTMQGGSLTQLTGHGLTHG